MIRNLLLSVQQQVIDPDEVYRISAENCRSRLYLYDGTQYLTKFSLHSYERLLREEGFLRFHKSHLIKQSAIVLLKVSVAERIFAVVFDGSEIPLGLRVKDEVTELLAEHGVFLPGEVMLCE